MPAPTCPRAVFQDFFFYSLVYDPQQKTLLADKGEIRVGNRYQADITDLLKEGRATRRCLEGGLAVSRPRQAIGPPPRSWGSRPL